MVYIASYLGQYIFFIMIRKKTHCFYNSYRWDHNWQMSLTCWYKIFFCSSSRLLSIIIFSAKISCTLWKKECAHTLNIYVCVHSAATVYQHQDHTRVYCRWIMCNRENVCSILLSKGNMCLAGGTMATCPLSQKNAHTQKSQDYYAKRKKESETSILPSTVT